MAIEDPKIFTAAVDDLLGSGNWVSDDHCAHLFTAYTFDASDATKNDMVMTEVAATGGYSQDGELLSGEAVNTSGANVYLDSDAIEWTSSTITAKYLVVFQKGTGALQTTHVPVFYISLDSGGDVSSTSGTFKVTPNANGWFGFA